MSSLEAEVANRFVCTEHEVHVIRCRGIYVSECAAKYEATFGSIKVNENSDHVCDSCILRSKAFNNPKIKDSVLDDYLSEEDKIKAHKLVAEVTTTNWHDFEIERVPIGRIASYEYLLKYKIREIRLPEEFFPEYKENLKSAILCLWALERAVDTIQPDRILVGNHLYSLNHVARWVAKKKQVVSYGIHGSKRINVMHTSFFMSQEVDDIWMFYKNQKIIDASKFAIQAQAIHKVQKYYKNSLIQSQNYFGARKMGLKRRTKVVSPGLVREKLGIAKNEKIVLIATTSGDELFAWHIAKNLAISTNQDGQLTWLEDVIRIAKLRKELNFVIRIHPREFSEMHREGGSDNSKLMAQLLNEVPDNIFVNWPSQGIGLYDLMQIASAVLVGRSSVAAEALMMGIPVVCHDAEELIAFPPHLTINPHHFENYDSALDHALTRGLNVDNLVEYFRIRAMFITTVQGQFRDNTLNRSFFSFNQILRYLERTQKFAVPSGAVSFFSKYFYVSKKVFKSDQSRITDIVTNGKRSLQDSDLVREDELEASDLPRIRDAVLCFSKNFKRSESSWRDEITEAFQNHSADSEVTLC
jgi:glycosyltransferase involved in cell wall biosynthesis